ncbi:MAG: site-2 protease family protein [Parachlamydiaceae bacterium]
MLIVVPYLLLQSDLIDNGFVRYVLYVTLRLNILWCLFNLIPICPLDGGHIARYLLQRIFGEKGVKISLIVGVVATALGSPYFLLEGYYFFGGILLVFGYQNIQMYRQTAAA